MKTIFVDGYNVINNWPDLNKQKEISYESARQSLIDKVHNYGVYNGFHIVLVFDAYKVHGNIEKREVLNKNISVVFTKDGETADAYIEKKVNSLGRKHEVAVVTSDKLEQQTIFQRGAVRISCLEFYNEVKKMEKSIKNKSNNKTVSGNFVIDNVDETIVEALEKLRRGN